MDSIYRAIVGDDETPATRAILCAARKADVDEMLTLALEDPTCNGLLLRFTMERVLPSMSPAQTWSMVRHLDCCRFPIIALDILSEEFAAHPTHPDLIAIAHNAIVGWALWGPHSVDMCDMLTSCVCRAVLRFMQTFTLDSANREDSIARFSSLILEYRLPSFPHFRTCDGINTLVNWLIECHHESLHRLVTYTLVVQPHYVYHSPHFASAVLSTIFYDVSNESALLQVLFSDHAVPCLIMLARALDSDMLTLILDHLRVRLGDSFFDLHITPVWPSCSTAKNPPTRARAYECPITLSGVVSPCVASDGFTYERSAILDILSRGMVSPMTRERLDIRLVENDALP